MAKKPQKTQEEIPGMNGPGVAAVNIPEVDELAAVYARARDKRMEQTPKEVESKKKLIAALHKYEDQIGRDKQGVLRYRYEGLIVELSFAEEKLKVRKADEDDE
jgi:hypothetical protein